MGKATFNCGHDRSGANVLTFKNGSGTSDRCRKCHNAYQTARQSACRGALKLVIRLHVEGTLSEGQVVAATGLSRVEIRELADVYAHEPREHLLREGADGDGVSVAGDVGLFAHAASNTHGGTDDHA